MPHTEDEDSNLQGGDESGRADSEDRASVGRLARRHIGRGKIRNQTQKNFRSPANTVWRGPYCGANTPTPVPERIS